MSGKPVQDHCCNRKSFPSVSSYPSSCLDTPADLLTKAHSILGFVSTLTAGFTGPDGLDSEDVSGLTYLLLDLRESVGMAMDGLQ